jgi:anthranilate phosphoribosyltransferase
VATVGTNAKYHSNQKMTDLFIAENVFRNINRKNEAVVISTEGLADLDTAETEALDFLEDQEMTDLERCSQQHVATVGTNAKYHSNQKMTDLFIAENVFKTIDKIKKIVLSNSQNLVILLNSPQEKRIKKFKKRSNARYILIRV